MFAERHLQKRILNILCRCSVPACYLWSIVFEKVSAPPCFLPISYNYAVWGRQTELEHSAEERWRHNCQNEKIQRARRQIRVLQEEFCLNDINICKMTWNSFYKTRQVHYKHAELKKKECDVLCCESHNEMESRLSTILWMSADVCSFSGKCSKEHGRQRWQRQSKGRKGQWVWIRTYW